PDDAPPISAVTDQKELWDKYKAPAPPVRTSTATRALVAVEPITRKIAASAIPNTAIPRRPVRAPLCRLTKSLKMPPSGEHTAMARKGSIEYRALVFRLSSRTSAK